MAFTTPSYSLPELFARIDRGELQLPDFQRQFSWDVDRIRSLIVTVLRGYPVGALLALDTRGEPMRFRPRPVSGAPDTGEAPGLLLLDGQQRLTTLYHTFHGDGYVDTRDFRQKRITRRFYVDVQKAVTGDVLPDEAVFAVNEHGLVMSHFAPHIPEGITSAEDQVATGCVPIDALLGQAGTDLLMDIAAQADEPVREAIKRFHHQVVAPLAAYDIPMIRLGRETARAGIGSIFAQANSAGLQMDVFELLTAVFALEDPSFSLAEDAKARLEPLAHYPVLGGIGRNEFLTAVTLVVTGRKGHAGGQREDALSLTLSEWRSASKEVSDSFITAAKFLTDRAFFTAEQVPYMSQVVALAAILTLAADDPATLSTTRARDRLNQWFWCGVLGELYGSASVDLRQSLDVAAVTQWLRADDAPAPTTVNDARFAESRLLSITPKSAVWKGMNALLMARGAKDWRTGLPFDATTVEELQPTFERIFPLPYCKSHGIDDVMADSIFNYTPMGKRTEVVIQGNDPMRYLPRVQSKSLMDDDEFDAVLATHELNPALLHISDFKALFEDRRERFNGMVEYALGRRVIRDIDMHDLRGGDEGPDAFIS